MSKQTIFLAVHDSNSTYDLIDSTAFRLPLDHKKTYYCGSRGSPEVPNYYFYFKATTWPLVIRTVLLIFGMFKAAN